MKLNQLFYQSKNVPYCEGNLANILHRRELARRLEGTGVVAHAMHPGVIRSGFAMDGDTRLLSYLYRIGGAFMKKPAAGADTIVWLASNAEALRSTGEYWYKRRPRRIARVGRDDEAASRLWRVSEQLLAETPS